MIQRLREKCRLSGGEVVIANHFMAVRQQSIREVAAHEPRATCDNVLHREGSLPGFNLGTAADSPSDSSTMNLGRRLASS